MIAMTPDRRAGLSSYLVLIDHPHLTGLVRFVILGSAAVLAAATWPLD
jgi:hypothetical protein